MSGFVMRANLPEDAETILIGEKYARYLSKSLEKLDITAIFVPNNPDIDPRMSGHADLSLLHAGGERLYLAPYLRGSALSERLLELGAELVYPEMTQSPEYPRDAQLNLCAAGRAVFYCEKSACKDIVDYLTIVRRLSAVRGRQGYTRCSTCVVDEHSIITADSMIYAAAIHAGYDALLISAGHIDLSGFEYGFIGGAAFKLSRRVLAFTGSLDIHPDRLRILDFLSVCGIEPVYLTAQPLFDIGSAVPLTEK